MTQTATARPPMTEKQRGVYDFIVDFRARNGYCPAIEDICRQFSIARNGVVGHLWALRRKGYVKWEPNQARTLRPVEVPNG